MIRAVVFDFDGVLANSEPLHFRAFRDVLSVHGFTLSERDYYDRYLGFDDVGAFEAIGVDAGRPLDANAIAGLVDEKAARLEALEGSGSVLFPGAREVVQRMASRGLIAIASGALRQEILRVLDHESLRPFFPVIIAAEDASASKPDPAPYARAVESLGIHAGVSVAATECAALEDSKWGLQSAAAAGLRTIGITHTYSGDELDAADLVISHLDQLTEQLLERLA
jgi:beta-phosphoglucomutase